MSRYISIAKIRFVDGSELAVGDPWPSDTPAANTDGTVVKIPCPATVGAIYGLSTATDGETYPEDRMDASGQKLRVNVSEGNQRIGYFEAFAIPNEKSFLLQQNESRILEIERHQVRWAEKTLPWDIAQHLVLTRRAETEISEDDYVEDEEDGAPVASVATPG
jgi:hypothetical protein